MSNIDSRSAAPSVAKDVTVVLSVVQDDIRHVQTRATAALAIAAIFVTQIDLADLQAMSDSWNQATLVGIAALVAAGVFYFHYSQKLNQARLAIASDSTKVDAEWTDKFMRSRWRAAYGWTPLWFYRLGQLFFIVGAVVLFVVVAELVLTAPPSDRTTTA